LEETERKVPAGERIRVKRMPSRPGSWLALKTRPFRRWVPSNGRLYGGIGKMQATSRVDDRDSGRDGFRGLSRW
jgi:hypothetical protein